MIMKIVIAITIILSSVALEDLHLIEMTLVESSDLQRLLPSQVCLVSFKCVFCYFLKHVLLPSYACFATFTVIII